MTPMLRPLLILLLAATLLACPASVHADAEALLKQGRRLFGTASFRRAVSTLTSAAAQTSDARLQAQIQLYLGCSQMALRNEAASHAAFKAALTSNPNLVADQRRFKARFRQRLAWVRRAFFGTLQVRSRTPGLDVRVNGYSLGVPAGKAGHSFDAAGYPLPAGQVHVEVRHQKKRCWSRVLTVAPGQKARLTVKPGLAGQAQVTYALLGSGKVCTQDGWCWHNPLPQGNHLNGIWGSGSGDVFAVGTAGTILHHDGHQWAGMHRPPGHRSALQGVWGSGPSNVYAVGNHQAILRYDGRVWTSARKASAFSKDVLWDVWGSGPSDVYAVGRTSFHFDGARWRPSRRPLGHSRAWGTGPSDVYTMGDAGTLRFTGKQWKLLPRPAELNSQRFTLLDIWGSSPSDVFMVGGSSRGLIWRHDGQRGTLMNLPKESSKWIWRGRLVLNTVWGFGPRQVYVIGSWGGVLRYDGARWAVAGSIHDLRNPRLWGSGPTDLHVVGHRGRIQHYDGKSWRSKNRTLGVGLNFQDVLSVDARNTYVVGRGGTILHHDGQRWITVNRGHKGDTNLNRLWASGPGSVLAARSPDHMALHNGSSWNKITGASSISRAMTGMWGTSLRSLYGVCSRDSVFRFDGTAWRAMKVAVPRWTRKRVAPPSRWGRLEARSRARRDLHGVWGSGPRNIFAVGRNGTILRFRGRTWKPMKTQLGYNQDMYAVWGSGPKDIFAVGKNGLIVRHDGSRWKVMDAPQSGQALRDVWGSGPRDVYAVGAGGVVLHFDGQRWRPMESGTRRNLNAVSGSGPDNVFVVGDDGTILHLGAV